MPLLAIGRQSHSISDLFVHVYVCMIIYDILQTA